MIVCEAMARAHHLFQALLVLFASALVFAGCDRSSTGVGAKSQILVYTAMEADQVKAIVDAFRAEHPDLDVTVLRESTGVITARLLAEAAAPRADVVWGLAATSLLAAEQKGLFEPYAPAGLEHIEARFRDGQSPPRWVGTGVLMTAFAANAPELKRRNVPVPASFEDLADPRLRGGVTMPNPSSSGTGFLILLGILQWRGEEAGWAYHDRLHANVAQYTHSGSKPATMASSGEYAVGVSLDFRCVSEKSRGAPVEVVFPAEKSGWDLEAMALVKKKDAKPAAKVFFDWAVSPAAFAHYTKYCAIVSHDGFRSVPPGYPPKPLEHLADLDLRWAAENRERILAEWNRRYGGKSEPK
jgi:iron(III) transport system substrate-binding protein